MKIIYQTLEKMNVLKKPIKKFLSDIICTIFSSKGKNKRRIHNEKLLKLFLFKFDLEPNFVINQKEYMELLNYGTICA
jgi:hypothetical protein